MIPDVWMWAFVALGVGVGFWLRGRVKPRS